MATSEETLKRVEELAREAIRAAYNPGLGYEYAMACLREIVRVVEKEKKPCA